MQMLLRRTALAVALVAAGAAAARAVAAVSDILLRLRGGSPAVYRFRVVSAGGFVAVVFGAANVFGGYMVTDRMLQMFKRKKG